MLVRVGLESSFYFSSALIYVETSRCETERGVFSLNCSDCLQRVVELGGAGASGEEASLKLAVLGSSALAGA